MASLYRKIIPNLPFLLALVCSPHPLYAEILQKLSFNDCISEMQQNNPEIQSLHYSREATAYQKKAAQAEYMPNLNASVSGSHSESDSWGSSSRRNNTNGYNDSVIKMGNASDSSNVNGALVVRQNVFSGFAHEANIEIAEALDAQSRANIAIANAKLSAQLKIAYASLVYWKRYVALATKIAQRRKENLGVVKLRYEGGNENKGSYLQAKALYDQAEYEKNNSLREVESAKTELAKVLGRNSSIDIDVIDKMPNALVTNYDLESELKDHPELFLVKSQRESAEAQLKSAQSGYYPNVDLSAQVGARDGSRAHDTEEYTVGFDVSIPIFTFGRVKNAVSKAKSELAAAKAREVAKEQELRSLITTAKTALTSAQDRVQIQKSLLDASAVRAEIGRHKYNIGLLDFENWDIIENELINYQKQELQSIRESVNAEAAWEQAIGQGAF